MRYTLVFSILSRSNVYMMRIGACRFAISFDPKNKQVIFLREVHKRVRQHVCNIYRVVTHSLLDRIKFCYSSNVYIFSCKFYRIRDFIVYSSFFIVLYSIIYSVQKFIRFIFSTAFLIVLSCTVFSYAFIVYKFIHFILLCTVLSF